ncbi:unnamed protein product [Cylicocyclus nassatus]|uniref:Tc1-like transposase DDE domain-containing protein n=1 Tax=Cylicocyclus nassatus TaxID=53992 RepID=A0AA36DQZ9_CYLNA|nr:unnamed protein product [Cylicocyclus nassatus]
MIRDVNKVKRVDFCTRMLEDFTSFSDCVFTDESTFQGFARLIQDNAPPHKSRFTLEKLKEWDLDTLEWPAESPDSNPIELVWGNMKKFISAKNVRTLDDLKVRIVQYWKGLTPDVCKKYVLGVRKKLVRVIEQGGQNILENR